MANTYSQIYIQNQDYHHRTKTYRDEYITILKEFAVEYDDRYLFEWIEKDQVNNK